MSFHTQFSKLTDEQCSAIGRVATNWSVVEQLLEETLARLAYAPAYLGRALTNDLGPDNRIRALRSLCVIHEHQLMCRVVGSETLTALRAIAKEFGPLKEERNKLVHWVAFRQTDEAVFFSRLRSRPATQSQDGDGMTRTVMSITEIAVQISYLGDHMESVCRLLPDLPWP